MHLYSVPDGLIKGRIGERYEGLRGQVRLALVDAAGRVHHYDVDEVILVKEGGGDG